MLLLPYDVEMNGRTRVPQSLLSLRPSVTRRRPPQPVDTDTVDLIIPCYNYGEYLAEAVDSAFAQSYPRVRVTAIDNGSTDDTNTVLAALSELYPSLHAVSLAHVGLGAELRFALESTQGEFFAILDADDYLEPTFVEKAVAVLQKNPAAAFCYSQFSLFGEVSGVYDPGPFDGGRLFWDCNYIKAPLFRRSAYCATSGIRDLPSFEDWDLLLSLLDRGMVGDYIPEPLQWYRIHSDSRAHSAWSRSSLLGLGIRLRHPRLWIRLWPPSRSVIRRKLMDVRRNVRHKAPA